jgi:Holliday junction resolvasome RuvABC endonuclease subunit
LNPYAIDIATLPPMVAAKWIGLDTAMSAFGWAVMTERIGEARIRLEAAGVWQTDKAHGAAKMADTARRVDWLAQQLVDLVVREKPQVIFVEGLIYMPGGAFVTASTLGRVRGIVEGIGKALDIPVHEFAAQTIKRALCGSPGAEKSQVAKCVSTIHRNLEQLFDFRAVSAKVGENVTDAVAVAHLGASHESVRYFVQRAEDSVPF